MSVPVPEVVVPVDVVEERDVAVDVRVEVTERLAVRPVRRLLAVAVVDLAPAPLPTGRIHRAALTVLRLRRRRRGSRVDAGPGLADARDDQADRVVDQCGTRARIFG